MAQTREEINAKQRIYYRNTNGAKKKSEQRLRTTRVKIFKDCNPYLGLSFNGTAVQSTLSIWGR